LEGFAALGLNIKGGPNGAAQVLRNNYHTTTAAQRRGGRAELRAAGRRP